MGIKPSPVVGGNILSSKLFMPNLCNVSKMVQDNIAPNKRKFNA